MRTLIALMVTVMMVAGAAPVVAADIVLLPAPRITGGKPLMTVLGIRRSVRSYDAGGILSLQQLSDLLWAGMGVNRPDTGKRTAPSALNQQEIDIFVATAEGVFRYDAVRHGLEKRMPEDIRALTGRQAYVADAAVNLIYVADYAKMEKLKTNADRDFYAAADSGFVAQNVYLFCASEGLGSVVRGSIDREALSRKLGLTAGQRIVLAQCVGPEKK